MPAFRTSARAVDMLGRQQIAGIPTAISELFKNAYDAYADNVVIDYFKSDGLLIIRDDGVGMSKDDFINRWLTLGTESKSGLKYGLSTPPVDPDKKKRSISGEKGIGRLAISTLGPQVLVLSRAKSKKKDSDLVCSLINWRFFEQPGLTLDEIDIPIKLIPYGTELTGNIISDLKNELFQNLETLKPKIDPKEWKIIYKQISDFNHDFMSMEEFLGFPSIIKSGNGLHFFIHPTSDSFQENLPQVLNPNEQPEFVRLLLGFFNTMKNEADKELEMSISFNVWEEDGLTKKDILDQSEFFTIDEFNQADHQIQGMFNEFGDFSGNVRVYDKKFSYELSNKSNSGRETTCGPFSINIGYIQGKKLETQMSLEDWQRMNTKLENIGGIYIYRDGIRVLPYGDPTYDFLKIEERRTKGAGYYYFSYRRMFGYIEISRNENSRLNDKAGREGFQNNRAYKEFQNILIGFLIEIAGSFFREGSSESDYWSKHRKEITQRKAAKKAADRRNKELRDQFSKRLDIFFNNVEEKKPESDVDNCLTWTKDEINKLIQRRNGEIEGQILGVEANSLNYLSNIRKKYTIEIPIDVGLSEEDGQDYVFYLERREQLEKDCFSKAEKSIKEIIDSTLEENSIKISNENRNDVIITSYYQNIKNDLVFEADEIKALSQKIEEKINSFFSKTMLDYEDLFIVITNEINNQYSKDNDNSDINPLLNKKQHKLIKFQEEFNKRTELISKQLSDMEWIGEPNSTKISIIEMSAAIEEDNLALNKQIDAYAELAQLGMAIEVISHEFNQLILDIKQNLSTLGLWADSNPRLKNLETNLRSNFEYLDSYLTLFTPLQRRMRRKRVIIEGSDIYKYIQNVFYRQINNKGIKIVATDKFINYKINTFRSLLYPIFINLIDNSIFWLSGKKGEKLIILDADDKSMIVSDNGPGVNSRNKNLIFEMGFSTKPGGRGLGLYISRKSLRKEDFDLVFDETYSDNGTTFRIIFNKA